ncbi:36.4 kDa proline-rich protein-like [Salvia splendens]|uniref:36.4 kDa proline-rich protein-like n=1 Tax=Salvia splendens TaxID=180675 RepID=UPI001C27B884|nr:36.4 kDa proline-rich protein-like [Salvia splendens]
MSSTKFLISIILVALVMQASAAGNRRLLNIPGFQFPPYMNIPTPVLLPPLLPSPTNIPPVVFPSTPPSDPTSIPVPAVFLSNPPTNPTLPNVPTVFPPPSVITTP